MSGRFYPANASTLDAMVRQYLEVPVETSKVRGAVVPHAGYVYSGEVAGRTIASIELPQTVLLMGPKHTRLGEHSAIMHRGAWSLPGEAVPIHEALADHLLQGLPGVVVDAEAHREEHALEVILPFLRARRPDVRFVPLILGFRSYAACEELGRALAKLLEEWDEEVLVIASSDMNHFDTHDETLRKDQMALDKCLSFDPQGLYEVCREHDISMCGVVPTTAMMVMLAQEGINSTRLVQHMTSGDVSGDTRSVVGYAGMLMG